MDSSSTTLTYNPSTSVLTATTFSGALSGNATTATTATNIAGGAGGSVPYQTSAGATALLANGTEGQVLASAGTTLAPTWSSVPIALINIIYPIGIIINTSVATNPGTYITGTTWVAYGAGQVLVGKAPSGTFSVAGSTGGAETVVITSNNLPAHSHPNTLSNNIVASSSHTHTSVVGAIDPGTGACIVPQAQSIPGATNSGVNSNAGINIGFAAIGSNNLYIQTSSTPSATTTVGITNANNSTTNTAVNILQPYVVVYSWTRTA